LIPVKRSGVRPGLFLLVQKTVTQNTSPPRKTLNSPHYISIIFFMTEAKFFSIKKFDPKKNYEKTKKIVGYLPRNKTTSQNYYEMGYKCGLEIHQQLKTEKKLFCRCPAGIYQNKDDYDAEIIRHMRPTLSEMGEYDGTALMEFKTKKNIIYHIKNETACTYEIDDTPPFILDRNALHIVLEISLLLNTSIVGEFHITRKQYLDGSIPTGFQRTGLIGIEGEIQLKKKKIRIIQVSLEEDACREVSDIGHERVYVTDRLGMPLVEIVTYPDMKTPAEAAEAGQYLRFLTRSTGKVRTGIGAGREDVNVSIDGGTRVEIKGVSHIKWIPELTHNEAYRQKALLEIRKILTKRIPDSSKWKIKSREISSNLIKSYHFPVENSDGDKCKIMCANLPDFKGILSFFTQPDKMFANELSDRLKVIACLEKPNMIHSEELEHALSEEELSAVKKILKSKEQDAQIIFWGSGRDIETALETIEERCLLAFRGVPNETRKSLKDGTTIFERVLPGPNRMYPDTDSAPIPIEESQIKEAQKTLPSSIASRIKQLKKWKIPSDTYTYILKRNLFDLIRNIIRDYDEDPVFVGTLIGHTLKNIEGKTNSPSMFNHSIIYDLFSFVIKKNLKKEIIKEMLPIIYKAPDRDFDSVLMTMDYKNYDESEIISTLPELKKKFKERCHSNNRQQAESLWIMGELHPLAIGNMRLEKLRKIVDGSENE